MRLYSTSDYPDLTLWYQKRNSQPPAPHELPGFGLIEPDVAAGFLMKTDTSMAFITNFISNPAAPSHTRRDSLLTIGDGLVGEARKEGFSAIMLYSIYPGIARWAKEHDFLMKDPSILFTKELA